MAKYQFQCPNCEYETIIESFSKPVTPICITCDTDMERVINTPQTIIKGASSDNNFYVPPTNAELGMPSDYTVAKESTKSADSYLDSESREEKRELDRAKAERAKERSRSIDKLKQKYPEFYSKFKQAEAKMSRTVKDKQDRKY